MSTPIERRLHKLEEIRDRNDTGKEVDIVLEKMGTSRAAVLADFGSLAAFRDWLAARIAATDHQAGVPIAAHPRQWQGDCAISAKWDAILDHADALKACDLHGRHLGMWNDRIAVTGEVSIAVAIRQRIADRITP